MSQEIRAYRGATPSRSNVQMRKANVANCDKEEKVGQANWIVAAATPNHAQPHSHIPGDLTF